MKAVKVDHNKGLEAAMGMTFNALNKLRKHGVELNAVKGTRYFTAELAAIKATVDAQIDAAHAAMAAYRAEQNIDSHNKPIIKK